MAQLLKLIQGFVDVAPNILATKEDITKKEVAKSSSLMITGVLTFILTLMIWFAAGYGAAKLSYCYNIHIGNSSGTAVVWSFLAFIFAGFYYPYYGLFLNPLCSIPMVQSGGRRRRL